MVIQERVLNRGEMVFAKYPRCLSVIFLLYSIVYFLFIVIIITVSS